MMYINFFFQSCLISFFSESSRAKQSSIHLVGRSPTFAYSGTKHAQFLYRLQRGLQNAAFRCGQLSPNQHTQVFIHSMYITVHVQRVVWR